MRPIFNAPPIGSTTVVSIAIFCAAAPRRSALMSIDTPSTSTDAESAEIVADISGALVVESVRITLLLSKSKSTCPTSAILAVSFDRQYRRRPISLPSTAKLWNPLALSIDIVPAPLKSASTVPERQPPAKSATTGGRFLRSQYPCTFASKDTSDAKSVASPDTSSFVAGPAIDNRRSVAVASSRLLPRNTACTSTPKSVKRALPQRMLQSAILSSA